ncbi:helix-loop-helix protein delilah-like [Diorhabda carinulata]|uniref:helix-loop-helix protein delilah-like n=1 Tax=Diorhabda sublineata TaxID=1163346 RepID=UPI0024E07331|nr:helix-loop-helix protein delilah-like [Diorhabda sublineata]XP_057668091.1 helix-loop-helix protein delilah-like [Diorhabda carinulata]
MNSLLQYSNLSERLSSQLPEINFSDDNNNNHDFENTAPTKEDKYSLRPRSLRRVTENAKESLGETTHRQSKTHKPKQKAAPLSKYRRKTANARERNRMREINQAFETLRRIIPHMQATHIPGANEKLTKITTLRLAMKYISTLSAALNGSTEIESLSDYSDFDCLFLESDGESISDHSGSLLTSPDFPEPSLSPVDFGDPSLPALLHTDFTEHSLEPADFSDFLLT